MHLPISTESLLAKHIIESDRIEFKRDWNPEVVLRSLCAFANDFQNFGGGYIVIGVEEINGEIMLPPKGIEKSSADKIQKELVRICSFLKPTYTPITCFEEYQGKWIFIIWVPGGYDRPYTAPKTLGKNKEYTHYIRKCSSTVVANNDELKELIELTARIPFDDRPNPRAILQDINISLIQAFLKNVNSDLLEESKQIPLNELCQQMALIDGGKENLTPRNVALMFFNDAPHKFFPYASN